jgi:hypothetical protein
MLSFLYLVCTVMPYTSSGLLWFIVDPPNQRRGNDGPSLSIILWALFNFSTPGNRFSGKPTVYGKLEDVTVSQALDHVLRTFPGFWLYENCANKDGERTVYFSFVESPPRTEKTKP